MTVVRGGDLAVLGHAQLGWDLFSRELTTADWLLIPQQRLLGITEGAVFADSDGSLTELRGLGADVRETEDSLHIRPGRPR